MTSEEIQAAIEHLRSMKIADIDLIVDVCRAFLGGEVTGDELHYTLIDLLEQADPDTHMELPVDADGEVIHIGDELCGYGRPDGGVYCKATNGYMVFVGEDGECAPKQWMVWDPYNCRHYHKPTVEDVLEYVISVVVEYANEHRDKEAISAYINEAAAVYAEKIREVMADE